ncbi:MAG: hypothetical protein PHI40_02915 [Caldisericia bacterium]|nr:hypothetical protein [Caldisericia bacterium]MDD4614343.1 hypothetical protein [Caldisericia bacterium]
MNQVVSLYEFGTVERAFSPAGQTNCFQGQAYNPYGIEIPFQFDGRDRTISCYALTGEKQNYEEKIWITVKNGELH